jgi:hypothetical protein
MRAESLERTGALTARERHNICGDAFRAASLDRLSAVMARLPDATPEVEALDVNRVRNELRPLDCRLERSQPASYAGFRLAHENRLVEFGFVSDLRRQIVAVRHGVPFPARVSGFAARFALVELRYACVMVSRSLERLDEDGIAVMSLNLSVERNAVVVTVAEEVEAARRTLTDRFGPALVVEQGFGARFAAE